MLNAAVSLFFRYAGLLAGLAYLLWMNACNEIPVDAGDGVVHYSIAKQAWAEPVYFLDHWGKPLFTLLSSGFAQLSFQWYVDCNVLIFALTCLAAFGILRHFKAGWFYFFLFPLLLICVPDYAAGVLAGMTEPLFGLLLTVSVLLALKQRWMLFAIVVSLLPFARSEGMLAVLLAGALLLIARQWKALPLLAAGFCVYALAGWYLLDDALWYFHNDPYGGQATGVYGYGKWWSYLASWKLHFGLITLVLLPVGAFGWLVVWKKRLTPHFLWILLFVLALYAGIFAVHSYLWMFGLKGAAGLTRLLTMSLPAVTILILVGCHAVTRELNAIPHILGGLVLVLLIGSRLRQLPYPLKADPLQQALIDATDYVRKHHPDKRIYYFHPIIPWHLNIGMKEAHPLLEQRFFAVPEMVTGMQPGSFVIRDPQFGPMEQGLTLDLIGRFPEKMVLVKTFRAKGAYSVSSGEPPVVLIYEVR